MLGKGFLVVAALLAGAASAHAQQGAPAGCSVKWDFTSQDFVGINENHYRLVKNVRINCNDTQLFADEAEVFSDADRVRASGNVVFVSATNRISADRMEYNTRTRTGTFYDASGIANLEGRGFDRSLFGTQEPDAYFWGQTIEKLGPRTYRISHGGFTTCVQPTPRWEFVSNEVTLTLEKHALIKNAVLKVKDVPVFYLPALYYPINKEDRATGFLIPIYGSSDTKGQTLSNAFFWAINRSQDATFYHSYHSKSGQSFGGEYRYIEAPGSAGNFQTTIVQEPETITYQQSNGTSNVVPGIDSYTISGTVMQQLPKRLRVTGNANYFSSLVAQQRYQQGIFAATNRTRTFGINAVGSWGANTLSSTVDRNETFTNDTDSTIAGSLPRVNYSRAEKPLFGSPVYFGAGTEYVNLIRTGHTATVDAPLGLNRIDLVPSLRFPFTRLQYLTFNSSMRFHETYWSESLDDRGRRVADGIQRHYFDLATSITGPVFTKIFNTPGSGYAQKWKHVIEPSLVISRKTQIDNEANIVKLEGTDFAVGGHTDYVYGVNNRFYAKKETSREILNVSLSQTYYSDDRAATVDPNYQSSFGQLPPNHFSPLTLQAHASPTTVTDLTFRAEYNTQVHALSSLATNGGLSKGWIFVNAGWSLNRQIPTTVGAPVLTASHYLNAITAIRKPGNAWSATYGFNYDLKNTDFLNQRLIAHYNTQCCGLLIEYQKFNFGTRSGTVGVPTDHRFNLSFTLAGIGTFTDLFGAFGGQQTR
jgi:LPS-assembly protein